MQQAFNVASLKDVTDSQTATAYSVGQQLVTTAWSLLYAARADGLGVRLGWGQVADPALLRGGQGEGRPSVDDAPLLDTSRVICRVAIALAIVGVVRNVAHALARCRSTVSRGRTTGGS